MKKLERIKSAIEQVMEISLQERNNSTGKALFVGIAFSLYPYLGLCHIGESMGLTHSTVRYWDKKYIIFTKLRWFRSLERQIIQKLEQGTWIEMQPIKKAI